MELGRLRSAIGRDDLDEDRSRRRLGVQDHDVEIAILGEGARVDKVELRIETGSPLVLRDEALVGKGALRVFVEVSEKTMARRGVR